jgi:hypothetical protein
MKLMARAGVCLVHPSASVALAALLWASSSLARTEKFDTTVHCRALSPEMAAEFEARARVDLSVRSERGGALELECDDLIARVTWLPEKGGRFTRSVPMATESLVDALLVAVANLAHQATAARQDADAVRVVSPPASSEAPMPMPPAAEPVPKGLALGLALGAQASIFPTGQGTLGPEVGLVVGLPANLVAGIYADYAVGLGAGEFVGIRLMGGTALLSGWFGERGAFEVGVGTTAGVVEVSTVPPFGPSPQTAAFLGGVARARYALQADSWRVAFGADLRFYGAPTSVAVNGATIWKLSGVTAGVSLDLTTRIYGRLW